jgi:hypothetical protein
MDYTLEEKLTRCRTSPLAINFTHRIDKFSFGKDYPNQVNPLDNSVEISEGGKYSDVHVVNARLTS